MPPNPLQTVVLKTDDYTGYHGFLIAESKNWACKARILDQSRLIQDKHLSLQPEKAELEY